MMLFCCCFVEVRIFIFYVLFFSYFCFHLFRDRPFFCAVSKFVCVCVLFAFHYCSVLFVIKEGKSMMLFCCCFVEVRIFIFYVLFFSCFCSFLYRNRPFFCAVGKFVCVCVCVLYLHFIIVRSC